MRTQIHSATLCASLLAALSACTDNNRDIAAEPTISLTTELGGSAEGYQRACNPREFTFPADHGAHPEYRNEWWYVTGNLNNEGGQRFGFHATYFRIANQPMTDGGADAWQSNSNWTASQFYMGHFAISEEGTEKAAAHERFARCLLYTSPSPRDS